MNAEQLSTEHAGTMAAIALVRKELCQMRRGELIGFCHPQQRERMAEHSAYNSRLGRIAELLEGENAK